MTGQQKYPFKQTLEEVGQKYEPFRILKNIGQEMFQLKLSEEWMIHDVFNEDLLTRCKELQFKG